MRSGRKFALFLALAVCAVITQARATQKQQPAPVPHKQAPAAQTEPAVDPARAIHDVSVGKFYMDQGDYTGAIARFRDALRFKPHYAEPCLLLGHAYEKSNDPRRAIIFYQKYLQILPDSSESKKVRKRIAVLRTKLAKLDRRQHSRAH